MKSSVFTPKRNSSSTSLSKQAIERSALRKSALAASLSSERLPFRQHENERPSYSKEFLAELKDSTPGTPQNEDGSSSRDESGGEQAGHIGQELDIASKFGSATLARYEEQKASNSAIPTDAEIQEKKARRARLAKELKYKSKRGSDGDCSDEEDDREESSFAARGHDSDSDEFRLQRDHIRLDGPEKRSKYGETRLVHDDEDMLEDFESFVDDGAGGRIQLDLGRKAQKEARRRQREQIKEMIDEAEGDDTNEENGDESDDSEKERREEYEAVQTRKGMEGLAAQKERDRIARPRTPPRITPLPTLSGVREKLRARMVEVERQRKGKLEVLEGIEKERKEIREREVEIQRLLKEAGERYEKLRAEALSNGTQALPPVPSGIASGALTPSGMGMGGFASGFGMQERGLESLGSTPLRVENGDAG